MSIKLKLVSLISAFILVLSLVIVGVLAATSKTINMSGNVQFVVADQSLWVKEVRMQEAGSPSDTITFTPGYINGGFNLDLTSYTESNINNRGSFTIYFDIINTTTTAYDVSVDYSGLSSITGLEVSITSEVPASEEAITTITADTPKTTTLELKVVNPNLATIDLSQIIITFEKYVQKYTASIGNSVDIWYQADDGPIEWVEGKRVGGTTTNASVLKISFSNEAIEYYNQYGETTTAEKPLSSRTVSIDGEYYGTLYSYSNSQLCTVIVINLTKDCSIAI